MLPHKKDGEQETANNLQFHGTFNRANRQNTDSQAGDSGLARYAGVQPGDQLPCGAAPPPTPCTEPSLTSLIKVSKKARARQSKTCPTG